MSLDEIITIGITGALVIVAAWSLILNYKNSNKQMNKQIELLEYQTKINSAKLIHTLREPWRIDRNFKKNIRQSS